MLSKSPENLIPMQNVLISVTDKSELESVVPALIEINPTIRLLSTGGTYTRILDILGGEPGANLIQVADYTNLPEMEGGLVKTLSPMIFAGILGERNHPAHQQYIDALGAEYIDAVLCNLYAFEKAANDPTKDFEQIREQIDVGGPSMIRAAGKNFLGCAALNKPENYAALIDNLRANNGCTDLEFRAAQVSGVYRMTGNYDLGIAKFMEDELTPEVIKDYLKMAA